MATAMIQARKETANKEPVVGSAQTSSASAEKIIPAKPRASKTSEGKANTSASSSALPPAARSVDHFNTEAIRILQEMNNNISKTNEKVESLSVRVDNLYDTNYHEYDGEYYEDEMDCSDNFSENFVLDEAENEQKSEDDSIFGKYAKKFKKTDTTDDPINESLADIVNEAFREGMSDDNYSLVSKNISRPENCDALKETKVNPGVWSVLRANTQIEDSKMRGIQTCVVKATSNFVKILDKQGGSLGDDGLELGMNAIGLLGQANKWINSRRKENHKKDMDPKLHHLCSSASFSEWLYGDTIIKDIKDIQELNKISKSVQSNRGRGRGQRGGRYNRGRYRPYQRRGRGAPQTNSQILAKPKNSQRPEVSVKK